ncbi:MAG: hypothetical protein F4087_06285 [Gemmatimonadetes bacterium]|nr:hypothetical protein [Gemmatimonadota bacterium]MYA12538.1 hypothetical protein [Gemmatimonadota bacterium]MYE70341.1 hypothetical protein [Gemmatimonadota bacterium]MYJ68104.1 hypothetical protein [Gemmatimonadota bacterium]
MTRSYGDFHSHLVPGVDDGSRSLEDALHSVDRMVSAGVTRVITTPHFRSSLTSHGEFEGYMAFLDRRWKRVRRAVAAAYPHLDFRRGFEVRLDTPAPDLSDPRLHLGDTPFVLVEWSMFTAPPGAPELLARLGTAGHIPIVAHPERYGGIDEDLGAARAWKEAGALLQGNYGSLAGQNGPRARKVIFRMLEEGLLDYLCSDFHGRPEYTFYLPDGATELTRQGGGGHLDLLGKVNPRRLFEGKRPHRVPPLQLDDAATRMLHGFLS